MHKSLYEKFPHLRQYVFFWRWPLRTAAAAVTASALAGLVLWGWSENLKSSDWASWVQALGSIAAVIGAWLIGARQSKDALNQAFVLRSIERQDRLRANRPIAMRAVELLKSLDDEPAVDYYRKHYNASAFRYCQQALEAIPLHELGNYGLIEGYLDLQDALETGQHAAAQRLKLGLDAPQRWASERASSDDISAARGKAEGALSLIMNAVPMQTTGAAA